MPAKSHIIRLRFVCAIFASALVLTNAWAATRWKEKVLHNFDTGGDGVNPVGTLVSDAAGNLYGMTSQGGFFDGGTVFEFTPNGNGGWTETLLHNFDGTDGAYPFAGLLFDAAGNMYGTTNLGGPSLPQRNSVRDVTRPSLHSVQ